MHLPHNDISMYDKSFLSKAIDARMIAVGCTSKNAYRQKILLDIVEEKALCESLYIGYSMFFRNILTCSVLEQIVFPQLIQKAREKKRREIRIWSAGCSCGQEPYSLAIMLEEFLEKTGRDIEYRIFATDVSLDNISKAKYGCFLPENVENISMRHIKKWFVKQGDIYIVEPHLKDKIDFSVFDLLGNTNCPPASIFGDFDMILCCNLLFYYKPEYQKIIINKLGLSLANNGYFVTGETERGIVKSFGYNEMYARAAIFEKS